MKVIQEHKEQSLNNVYGSFWEECKQRLVLAALRMFTYSAQNLSAHPCLYAYCIYPRRIRMLGERPYNQEEGEIQTEPDLNISKFFFMTYSPTKL